MKNRSYILFLMSISISLLNADVWRCPHDSSRSFDTKEDAMYACPNKAFLTIQAKGEYSQDRIDRFTNRQAAAASPSTSFSSSYPVASFPSGELRAPQPKAVPQGIKPFSGNFPFAGISNYGSYSAGAGAGDF